jgi:fluoride exporter
VVDTLVYIWIAVGSATGGVARYALQNWAARHIGILFPWGTLIVNISGSLVIGLAAAMAATQSRLTIPFTARQFVVVGLCGGYTTFSSFSLETLSLARDGHLWRAAANAIASVVLCLVAVWAGYAAGAAISQK